MKEQCVV